MQQSTLETAAANGDFSNWATGLTDEKKERVAGEIATGLAAKLSSHTEIGQAQHGRLKDAFTTVLTSAGPDAANAARTILSIASVLPQNARKNLPGEFGSLVFEGAGGEIGAKAVDGVVGAFASLITSDDPTTVPRSVTVKSCPHHP